MGALEGGIIALVVVFFILRHFYLMLRWAYRAIRRTLGFTPKRAVSENRASPPPAASPSKVRRAQPLTTAPLQPVSAQTLSEPVPPQIPEGRSAQKPSAEKVTIRPDGNDLVRALIWQEILAPPLSKRNSKPSSRKIHP